MRILRAYFNRDWTVMHSLMCEAVDPDRSEAMSNLVWTPHGLELPQCLLEDTIRPRKKCKGKSNDGKGYGSKGKGKGKCK